MVRKTVTLTASMNTSLEQRLTYDNEFVEQQCFAGVVCRFELLGEDGRPRPLLTLLRTRLRQLFKRQQTVLYLKHNTTVFIMEAPWERGGTIQFINHFTPAQGLNIFICFEI